MSLPTVLFMPVLLILLVSGCQEREPAPEEGVRTTIYDKAELESRGESGKEPILLPVQREQYLDTMQALVEDYDEQVAAVEKKTVGLQESSRAEITGTLEEVKGLLNTAREQLSRLKSAGEEEWTQIQTELDGTLEKVKTSLAEIESKFPDQQ